MGTFEVKVYPLAKRDDRDPKKTASSRKRKAEPKLNRVRWVVAGSRKEKNFASYAQADNFRNDLVKAVRAGAEFDEVTGLPIAMLRERNQTTWYDHARSYIEMKWPELAANSRSSTVEALVTVTCALVRADSRYTDMDLLRETLAKHAFRPLAWSDSLTRAQEAALTWISKQSLPVVSVAKPDTARKGLNACGRKLDGTTAAPNTFSRKRAVYYNVLEYAVERELLEFNPLDKIKRTKRDASEEVDPRVVGNTAQVESILIAVPSVTRNGGRYVAHFGNLYYCGTRPSESANLRRADCWLPAVCLDCGLDVTDIFEPGADCAHLRESASWGRITLHETKPYVGAAWTDDGSSHEERGLKHRPRSTTRPVSCPPEQVRNLRNHIKKYKVTASGHLFVGERGGALSYSTCDRIWKLAREAALASDQVQSPLLGCQYDLRHAALSLWLNNGVPATEVARRAGQSVKVLLTTYAACIFGDEELVNARIATALAESRRRGAIGGQTRVRHAKIKAKRQVRSQTRVRLEQPL